MEAQVVWQNGMKFVGTAGTSAQTGIEVSLDADSVVGGADAGFRPLELMAMSLAGCTAMDVISILRKKRQDVRTFEVRVHADRAEEHPRVFTHMRVEYIFTGHNLDEKSVQRAIELSETKYCPAQGMLNKVMPIESSYSIVEVGA